MTRIGRGGRHVALVMLLLCACAAPPHPITTTRGAACRNDPFANVHDPTRLRLLQGCLTVTGTVVMADVNAHDHDANFDLRVDGGYGFTIGQGNRDRLFGLLHVEIVPADRPGCTRGLHLHSVNGMDVGTCTGADVPLPAEGEHVRVTGAYVVDVTNSWRELHPAWAVKRDGTPSAPVGHTSS